MQTAHGTQHPCDYCAHSTYKYRDTPEYALCTSVDQVNEPAPRTWTEEPSLDSLSGEVWEGWKGKSPICLGTIWGDPGNGDSWDPCDAEAQGEHVFWSVYGVWGRRTPFEVRIKIHRGIIGQSWPYVLTEQILVRSGYDGLGWYRNTRCSEESHYWYGKRIKVWWFAILAESGFITLTLNCPLNLWLRRSSLKIMSNCSFVQVSGYWSMHFNTLFHLPISATGGWSLEQIVLRISLSTLA